VIKGVRHCGKSNILLNFKKYLIDVCHVDEKNILMIEFEKIEFINLNDFIKLNEYILEKAKGLEKLYLLLDEIQNVNS
jgi:predicted AAA+ superfamily ATPase